ncbi:killer cell lectin-like receptor subfamily B member 1B allele C [Thunnus maccoyii]|uniref:killer cell lectin-like receptor subfamily B member 1B allele C n=1 Tax=Thunnus maccoyii TaxID=8240 RepID=UPI001C4B5651|nr:killer cell lectin-like receptor subfamily B member 1B allele C [Thunnus maccoyii]
MSTEIPAVPQLSLNVRYTRNVQENRGEGEENEVEIFSDEEHQIDFGSQTARPRTQKNPAAVKRSGLKAIMLGVLCLLLLTGIFIRYISAILEKDQLQRQYDDMLNNHSRLQDSVMELQGKHAESLCPEGWKRSRCSCYYKSTEMKSWDDSRADCKNRTADLVVINNKHEQEFLRELNEDGTSWIGLQTVKTSEWPEKWGWKWVDGSTPSYMAWEIDQFFPPMNWSTVFINQRGKWIISNESKQWICEKEVS